MVQRRGKVVHFQTYGMRDVEAGTPVERDTIFRIYSMTKPIVSVGLMTLYEEGRFQLDDPVAQYIPPFRGLKVLAGGTGDAPQVREPAREMTVADLLRHTSGLVNQSDAVLGDAYTRLGLLTSASSGTLTDMIKKLGTLPLKCDPGAQFNYGISTDVVGYLCEVLSGQRLDDFLRERILGPLGMVDTGFAVADEDVERFAACYRPGTGGRAAPGGRGPPRRVQPLHPAADVPVRRWRHGLHRVRLHALLQDARQRRSAGRPARHRPADPGLHGVQPSAGGP